MEARICQVILQIVPAISLKNDSTWIIPVHVQGRQREQKPNMVIPVGNALSGSAHWTRAHSPFLLPPLTLHLLEQSTNEICYDLYPLEQSTDRDRLFTTQSSLWVPGFLDASTFISGKSSICHLIHHLISS